MISRDERRSVRTTIEPLNFSTISRMTPSPGSFRISSANGDEHGLCTVSSASVRSHSRGDGCESTGGMLHVLPVFMEQAVLRRAHKRWNASSCERNSEYEI